MNRRGFLQSCLALSAAPAIVRADSLMRIVVPDTIIVPGYRPVISFSSDASTGLYLPSERVWTFIVSGMEKIRIEIDSEALAFARRVQ